MTSQTPNGGRPDRDLFEEARADTRRYLSALSRQRRLILTITGVLTVAVFFLSSILPKQYEADTTLVLDASTTDPFQAADAETLTRTLTTLQTLLTSSPVLDEAVKTLPGETVDSLREEVTSEVDENANLLTASVTNTDPEKAAEIVNGVVEAFLSVRAETERSSLQAASSRLKDEIAKLQARGTGSSDEINALRNRLSALGVQEANAGSDLEVAEPASVPTSASSPKPLRNAILTFFASALLGVLVALGRDQLKPRITEPRELGRLLGVPVLSSIPRLGRAGSRRSRYASTVEHEAYETLRAQIVRAVPPAPGNVIMVSSARHGEGKSTVTARLGRALAHAGHKVLLVSADLRWPTLHLSFDVPVEPGVADVMRFAEDKPLTPYVVRALAHDVGSRREDGSGTVESNLHVLSSGAKLRDPAQALSGATAERFFRHLSTLDYDYVLIDTAPLLGLADGQAVASVVSYLLIVARIDELEVETAFDLQELLDRLVLKPLGIIAIGASLDVSPYYLAERPGFPTPVKSGRVE